MIDFLIKYWFKQPKEILVFLSSKEQRGSLTAIINTAHLWKTLSLNRKFKNILTGKCIPDENAINEAAIEVFNREVFGTAKDFGDALFRLNIWHSINGRRH